MELLPPHSLGIQNAWWFSLIYGIASLIIMINMPKERRKRILTFPKFKSRTEKIFTGLGMFIFARGLILYSFFLPVSFIGFNFYIGTIIYLFGMVSSVYSMWFFAQNDLSKPVTESLFKITRHPMQVGVVIMYTGIGIASGNWIMIACSILLGAVSLLSFKAQERFCIEKYGREYLDYMNKTPRYLF